MVLETMKSPLFKATVVLLALAGANSFADGNHASAENERAARNEPVAGETVNWTSPTPAAVDKGYAEGRPAAKYRLDAQDTGVVLKHGDGPSRCDYLGPGGDNTSHLQRDVGLAWLSLPLNPPPQTTPAAGGPITVAADYYACTHPDPRWDQNKYPG